MKKITALLLCFFLLCICALTVFAETPEAESTDVRITVTVPDSHKITVYAEGAKVFFQGISRDEFTVERLSTPRMLIRPESGRIIRTVLLNGVDVTAMLYGSYLELAPVYEDQILTVITEHEPDIPPTGDDTHLMFWLILFLTSAGYIAVSETCRRKKTQ